MRGCAPRSLDSARRAGRARSRGGARAASSSIAACVPSATSTVTCEARPCTASWTAPSSSGSGQLRVASGTTRHRLRPSSREAGEVVDHEGVRPRRRSARARAHRSRAHPSWLRPSPRWAATATIVRPCRCRRVGAGRPPASGPAPRPAAAARPGRPRDRSTALRRGPRTSRSSPRTGTSTPSLLVADDAVRRPGDAARDPRPLRHPAAARQRRPARGAGGRSRAAHRRPGARRCGGSCARTGRCSAGRRCGTGWSRSWPRSSASTCGRRRPRRTRIYDQIAERLAEPAFRPASAVRAVPHRASSPPPTTRATTSRPMPRSPPTRAGRTGCCRRSGPTAYLESGRPDWVSRVDPAGRGRPLRHGDLRRLGRGDGDQARLLQGARSRLGGPQPRGRRNRAVDGRGRRAALRGCPGRGHRRGPSRCAGT